MCIWYAACELIVSTRPYRLFHVGNFLHDWFVLTYQFVTNQLVIPLLPLTSQSGTGIRVHVCLSVTHCLLCSYQSSSLIGHLNLELLVWNLDTRQRHLSGPVLALPYDIVLVIVTYTSPPNVLFTNMPRPQLLYLICDVYFNFFTWFIMVQQWISLCDDKTVLGPVFLWFVHSSVTAITPRGRGWPSWAECCKQLVCLSVCSHLTSPWRAASPEESEMFFIFITASCVKSSFKPFVKPVRMSPSKCLILY